jgi:oxygen-dependent protoporphyrinogen oxidase
VRRLAIIGGGITGLAAALRAVELSASGGIPVEVMLYESSENVGGCVQTVRDKGFTFELGPDSLLVEKPAAADLLRTLHLHHDVIDTHPEHKRAGLIHSGRMRAIPEGFRLFSPTSMPALLRSGIFSLAGIARAAMETIIPARRESGDESVSSFVRRRFGREVLDRLAQPLIGGIYSGDPARLGMRATLPQFLDLEARYGSVLRGMQSAGGAAAVPRLASLRNGVGSLVDALGERLRQHIRTSAPATSVRRDRGGWSIAFEGGASVFSDAIVFAVPAYAAADLLRGQDPDLADSLQGIRYNSIATVNLIYESGALSHIPAVSGFIVPFIERRRIVAATFSTLKYSGRAPAGAAIVRTFVGGALQPELLRLDEDQLADLSARELSDLLGIRGVRARGLVTKWMRLLPEYGLGHRDRVTEINARARRLGGLWLAGSAYGGVGIPDCVAAGQAAVESAFSNFST